MIILSCFKNGGKFRIALNRLAIIRHRTIKILNNLKYQNNTYIKKKNYRKYKYKKYANKHL